VQAQKYANEPATRCNSFIAAFIAAFILFYCRRPHMSAINTAIFYCSIYCSIYFILFYMCGQSYFQPVQRFENWSDVRRFGVLVTAREGKFWMLKSVLSAVV